MAPCLRSRQRHRVTSVRTVVGAGSRRQRCSGHATRLCSRRGVERCALTRGLLVIRAGAFCRNRLQHVARCLLRRQRVRRYARPDERECAKPRATSYAEACHMIGGRGACSECQLSDSRGPTLRVHSPSIWRPKHRMLGPNIEIATDRTLPARTQLNVIELLLAALDPVPTARPLEDQWAAARRRADSKQWAVSRRPRRMDRRGSGSPRQ